ncbi:hypothetical protein NDU88_005752 [Pleurodeles waltl]|uniref:Uncharacterized protein n=1 Tax=Pleurodeles waltl TaxID=8319 RepID=A0AAV7TW89_PLEWA|nr:hypothetical protein NDU88_005752 [Pleurodeles waltl]
MLSEPAGEPSNTRHPRGPRRKAARLHRASPLFWVADLCSVLRSPQAQGRAATTRGAGGRGVGCSTPPPVVVAAARVGGGAPLIAGQSVTRGRGLCSCCRPQVRAPLSPRYVRGERFSFSPGVGPPSPPTLRMCYDVAQGGSGAPPAPPPSTCGPSPCGARLLGGHPGSWPDHAPPGLILSPMPMD